MAETFHLLGQVLDSIAGRWYAGHFPFFCEVNIASNILNHLDLRVGGPSRRKLPQGSCHSAAAAVCCVLAASDVYARQICDLCAAVMLGSA